MKKIYLLLCMALLLTSQAHHFKGLPHFSYFENYPQVPTEEYLGQTGKYEFSLVIYDFQGINKNDAQMPDDVRLFLVIFDLEGNRTYQGPLRLDVLDGDRELRTESFASSVEESIYTIQERFPLDGDFSLRITFLENGEEVKTQIPFMLSDQKVNWGGWVAGFMFATLLLVAIGSRKMRLQKDRQAAVKKDNAQEAKGV